MPDKRKLYDALNGAEYYTKSYEEFDKQFSTDESIDKLYGQLNGAEYYTKSLDEFKQQFFTPTGIDPLTGVDPDIFKKKEEGEEEPVYGLLSKELQGYLHGEKVDYSLDINKESKAYKEFKSIEDKTLPIVNQYNKAYQDVVNKRSSADQALKSIKDEVDRLDKARYGEGIFADVPDYEGTEKYLEAKKKYDELKSKISGSTPDIEKLIKNAGLEGEEARVAKTIIESKIGGYAFVKNKNWVNKFLYNLEEGVESTDLAQDDAFFIAKNSDKDVIDRFESDYQDMLKNPARLEAGEQGLTAGALIGGQIKPIAKTTAAGIAGSLATPAVGAAAAISTGTTDSAITGFGSSYRDAYFKARQKGFSKEESHNKAMIQGWTGAAGGAAEGLLGSIPMFRGVKLRIGRALLDTSVDAVAAGASQFGQNLVAKYQDIQDDLGEGITENMLAEAIFSVGGQTAAKLRTLSVKPITYLKTLPAEIQRKIAEKFNNRMIESGNVNNLSDEITVKLKKSPEVEAEIAENERKANVLESKGVDTSEMNLDEVNEAYDKLPDEDKPEVTEEVKGPEKDQKEPVKEDETSKIEDEKVAEETVKEPVKEKSETEEKGPETEEEIVIPAETLSKANKSFEASKENLSEADASVEAFKTVERSDWYENLTPEQQTKTKEKFFNEISERFTGRPTEKKTREKLPSKGKKVTVDEAVELRRGLKKQEKAAKEGFKAGIGQAETAITEVKNTIKDFVKKNKARLTPRQYESIINRLGKGIKTEKQFDNLMNYVEKSIGDSKYAQRIDQAQKGKNLVTKKAKSGAFKKNFAQQIPEIRKFLGINPNQLDSNDLSTYNEITSNIAKGRIDERFRDFIGKYKPKKITTDIDKSIKAAKDAIGVNKSLNQLGETIGNIETLEDFSKARRSLNSIKNKASKLFVDGDISQSEYEAMLAGINSLEESTTIDSDRTLTDAENEIKNEYVDRIESTRATIIPDEFGEGYKPALETLSKADSKTISEMPLDMLDRFDAAMENLANGNVTADLFAVENYIKSKKIKKAVDNVGKSAYEKIGNSKRFKKLTDDVKKLKDKLNLENSYLMDYFFDTHKDRTIYSKIFRPIETAFTNVEKRVNDSTRDFAKAYNEFKKFKIRGKQVRKDMMGIVLQEARYRSNPITFDEVGTTGKKSPKTYKWEDLSNERKSKFGYLLNDNASINGIGGIGSDRYKRVKDAYEKLVFDENGVLDLEASMNLFNKNERAMMDAAKKSFEDGKELNKANATRRGELWTESNDYVPEYVVQKVGNNIPMSESKKAEADILDMSTGKFASPTTVSSAIHEKTNRVFFTETDIESITMRHARETAKDFYITQAYQQVNGAMTDAIRENLSDLNIANALTALNESIKDRIIHTQTRNILEPKELQKLASKVETHVRTMMLAMPDRIPAEFASNLAGAVISNTLNPFSVAKVKTNAKYNQLVDEIGSPSLTKLNRFSESQQVTPKKRGQQVADAIITISDKAIGTPIFIKNFNRRFKEITGQDFNIDKYLSDPDYKSKFEEQIEESASFGDASVQEEFNVISGVSRAPETRILPWGSNISVNSKVSKIFGFMQSFNTQEASLAKIGVKEIMDGNIRRGSSIIAARVARNFIYATTRGLLGGAAFALATGDEEELDKAVKKTKFVNNLIGGMTSMVVGRYGNLFNQFGTVLLTVTDGLKKDFDLDEDQKGSIELLETAMNQVSYSKPLRRRGDIPQALSRIIPIYGKVVESFANMTITGSSIAEKLAKGESLTDDEAEFNNMMAVFSEMINVIYANPASPIVTKMLRKNSYKLSKREEDKDDRVLRGGSARRETKASGRRGDGRTLRGGSARR